MADYKEFFNSDNPLNLFRKKTTFLDSPYNRLNKSKEQTDTTLTSIPFYNNFSSVSSVWNEEDEEQAKQQQLEEQKRQKEEELKKQLEERRRLEEEERKKELERLNAFNNQIQKRQLFSWMQQEHPGELLVYDSKNNAVVPVSQFGEYTKEQEAIMESYKKGYETSSKGILILSKLLNEDIETQLQFDEEVEKHKNFVKDHLELDEDSFNKAWASSDNEEKLNTLLRIVEAYQELSPEEQEIYSSLYNTDKLGYLAGKLKNNPFYQSFTLKHKEERQKKIKDSLPMKTMDAIDNTLTNIFSSLSSNPVTSALTSNGVFSMASNPLVFNAAKGAANIIKEGASKLTNWGWGLFDGALADEENDEFINNLEDDLVQKQSNAVFSKIALFEQTDPERYAAIIKDFDRLSQNSSDYMSEWLGNKEAFNKAANGLYALTDLEKARQYANYIVREQLFGPGSGEKGVADFWQNHIDDIEDSTVEGFFNKGTRTFNTFWLTAAADAAAFAGAVYSLKDPLHYTEDLVTDNPLVRWAADALATGCWTPEYQELYKEHNANANKIHKSVAEENSSGLTGDDIFDIAGQYGFTAATTAISLGGSTAVKGLSWGAKQMVKGALKAGVKPFTKKATRALIADGLASSTAMAEKRLALEAVWKMQLNISRWGNFAFSGAIGTAEGALEALGTYDTFMQENDQNDKFNQLAATVMDAEGEELTQLMEQFGIPHSGLATNPEKGSAVGVYTEEDYANAKLNILNQIKEAKDAANNKVREDAINAATTNFIVNSAINGFLQVTLKEAMLSKDAREAIKLSKGNQINDLLDITNKAGKWEATIKKAIVDTNKNNVFKVWFRNKELRKLGVDALKNIGGESLEEYSQNISDAVSRDVFQQDLDNYLNVVFNPEARNAFESSTAALLDTALQSVGTLATDVENLKAGFIGGASTALGGFSPVKAVSNLVNFKNREAKYKGKSGTAAYLLSSVWDNAFGQAYQEESEKYAAAERLAEEVNDWLSNEESQAVLNNLGGAIGFAKAILDGILAEDVNSVKDNQFGLTIEAVTMLKALENTEYGKAVQQKINERAQFDTQYTDDDFDDTGKYVGDNEAILNAITEFKNSNSTIERPTDMTDRNIMTRIQKNAQEFLDLLKEVEANTKRLNSIFNTDAVAPAVQKALIYGFVAQNNLLKRLPKLKDKINKAVESLSEEDKKQLLKSGLSETAIDLISEYGSVKEAWKELESINAEIAKQTGIKDYKKGKNTSKPLYTEQQKKEAKAKLRQLDRMKKNLSSRINKVETELKEAKMAEAEDIVSETLTDKFTAGDIANMPIVQRSQIIANKKDYSKEQLEEIDKYISIMQRGMQASEEDVLITALDVEQDLIDEGVMTTKLEAYNKHLNNYVSNARFLNTRAALLYQQDRKRVLKSKYKKDLEVQGNESPIQYISRLNAKTQVLKDLGKVLDAEIFQQLVNESPIAKRVQELTGDIQKVSVIYKLLKKISSDNYRASEDEDAVNVGAALETLMLNGNKNLKELQEIFDKADIDELENLLAITDENGESFFNKHRKELIEVLQKSAEEGEKTIEATDIDLSDKTKVDAIIQQVKDLLNNFKDSSKPKKTVTSVKVQPNTKGAGSTETPNTGGLNNKVQQKPVQGSSAKSTLQLLRVKTPGDIDNRLGELRDFLEEKNVSDNLKNTNNGRSGLNGLVKFAVSKEYKGSDNTADNPVIFVVSTDGKKILGVIDATDMPEIQSIASEAYKNAAEGGMSILKSNSGDITAEVPAFNTGNYVHDGNYADARELYKTPTEIGRAAVDIINGGSIKEVSVNNDPQAGKTKVLRYLGGDVRKVPRHISSNEQEDYVTIWTYPITVGEETYSLKDILELDPETAIKSLKADSFFNELFKKWGSYKPTSGFIEGNDAAKNAEPLRALSQLILDFIYIGKVKEPKVGDGGQILTFTGLNSEVSIPIPIKEMDTSNIDYMVLTMLKTLYRESTQIEDGLSSANLAFSEPNLSYSALEWALNHSGETLASDIRKREAAKLEGLIAAGYIETPGPGHYKAGKFEIKNPFYKQSSNQQSTTDSNASVPDNKGAEGNRGSKSPAREPLKNNGGLAAEIVKNIRKNSEEITLDDHNAPTYSKGSKILYRVTTLIKGLRALGKNKPKKFEGSAAVSAVSTTYGNVNDAIGREFFDYFYESEDPEYPQDVDKAVDYMADKVAKMVGYTKKTIPNMDEYLYKAIIKQFVLLKLALDKEGWKVASKNLQVDGSVDVYEKGVLLGTAPMGGALDLIAYKDDALGNNQFIIIDMKTVKLGDSTSEEALKGLIESRRSSWTGLTNAYSAALKQQNQGINIIGKYIFPIFLNYNDPGDTIPELEKDGITFTDQVSFQLLGDPISLGEALKDSPDTTPLLKCLVKMEDLNIEEGIDIEDILDGATEEEREAFIKSLTPPTSSLPLGQLGNTLGESASAGPKAADANVTEPEKPSKKSVTANNRKRVQDRIKAKNSNKSQRTKKQARFTEFINNHIAPIKEVKLGFVAKTITKIGEWFTKKENLDNVVKRDLANAFFGGDLGHLQTVLKDTDVNNIPQVIAALSDYYKAYVDKRDQYIQNISRRLRLNAALYDFFNGKISRNQLDRLLENIDVKAREVPILVDYLNSNNRPLAAKDALAKLEAKKEYTKEYAQFRVKEMTAMMDNMQTKLEFLQSPKAERMLQERLESVKLAILSGSYRETKVSKTAPSVMSIEKGTYGATGLLRNIIRHSDNAHFKRLARTLLSYIQENSIVINASIGDSLVDLVEGESKGRTISISKDSMDTFEHFERVFLHEVLHSVVGVSPELRETLEDLRKQAIFSIIQLSNMTEREVLDLIYGLTDVDEFITEFFTNYAFQDTLKQLTEEHYDNIFDSIVGKIKNHFTKDTSLYGKITDSMNTVMESIDIEAIKKEEVEIASGDYDSFERLSSDLQKAIKARGFTANTYNALNFLAREQLKRCCI